METRRAKAKKSFFVLKGSKMELKSSVNIIRRALLVKPPIPTTCSGDLMRLIRKENSFKFNHIVYLQTLAVAIGTLA